MFWPMPTTVLLSDDQGRPWRITLHGAAVITGEGTSQVVQELANEDQAREHFERVLMRRRRDRYTLVEVKEIDDSDPLLEIDPLGDRARWEPERGCLTITFKDTADRALCEVVVERVVKLKPRVLHLLCDSSSPGDDFPDALLSATLDSVEVLILDTYWQSVARQRRNYFGDLAEIFEAMPRLDRCFISGAIKATPFAHSRLRELYLLGDPLPMVTVAALAESQLPSLEFLGLTLASEDEAAPSEEVIDGLVGLDAPKLREVMIEGLADITGFLSGGGEGLAGGMLAEDGVLSLGGEIEDEDGLIEVLGAHKAQLGQLTRLALPLADALSTDGDAAARAVLPCLIDADDYERSMLPETYLEW